MFLFHVTVTEYQALFSGGIARDVEGSLRANALGTNIGVFTVDTPVIPCQYREELPHIYSALDHQTGKKKSKLWNATNWRVKCLSDPGRSGLKMPGCVKMADRTCFHNNHESSVSKPTAMTCD